MISDVVVGNSKKALNLVFIIFGYVLASYLVSSIELVFEQQIPAVIVAGGVFSSFLFYLRPIDRFLMFIILIKNRNMAVYGVSSSYLMSIYNSPFLADQRAKINGAVFFAISLLLASRLLSLINLYIQFEILLFFSSLMLLVAIWEMFLLISKRIPVISAYYGTQVDGTIKNGFKEAIERKDWSLAASFYSQLKRDYSKRGLVKKIQTFKDLSRKEGGFCPDCKLIIRRSGAGYCSDCGKQLITHCKFCQKGGYNIQYAITEETEKIPTFCNFCGNPFSNPSEKKKKSSRVEEKKLEDSDTTKN